MLALASSIGAEFSGTPALDLFSHAPLAGFTLLVLPPTGQPDPGGAKISAGDFLRARGNAGAFAAA